MRSQDNLSCLAGIPQEPLETSPGTIGIIQKRFKGFLKFLVFVKNFTKLKNWLSCIHFWANFQVSYVIPFPKAIDNTHGGIPEKKELKLSGQSLLPTHEAYSNLDLDNLSDKKYNKFWILFHE